MSEAKEHNGYNDGAPEISHERRKSRVASLAHVDLNKNLTAKIQNPLSHLSDADLMADVEDIGLEQAVGRVAGEDGEDEVALVFLKGADDRLEVCLGGAGEGEDVGGLGVPVHGKRDEVLLPQRHAGVPGQHRAHGLLVVLADRGEQHR